MLGFEKVFAPEKSLDQVKKRIEEIENEASGLEEQMLILQTRTKQGGGVSHNAQYLTLDKKLAKLRKEQLGLYGLLRKRSSVDEKAIESPAQLGKFLSESEAKLNGQSRAEKLTDFAGNLEKPVFWSDFWNTYISGLGPEISPRTIQMSNQGMTAQQADRVLAKLLADGLAVLVEAPVGKKEGPLYRLRPDVAGKTWEQIQAEKIVAPAPNTRNGQEKPAASAKPSFWKRLFGIGKNGAKKPEVQPVQKPATSPAARNGVETPIIRKESIPVQSSFDRQAAPAHTSANILADVPAVQEVAQPAIVAPATETPKEFSATPEPAQVAAEAPAPRVFEDASGSAVVDEEIVIAPVAPSAPVEETTKPLEGSPDYLAAAEFNTTLDEFIHGEELPSFEELALLAEQKYPKIDIARFEQTKNRILFDTLQDSNTDVLLKPILLKILEQRKYLTYTQEGSSYTFKTADGRGWLLAKGADGKTVVKLKTRVDVSKEA